MPAMAKIWLPSSGMKNEFITVSEVILKLTEVSVGNATSLMVAIPCSG